MSASLRPVQSRLIKVEHGRRVPKLGTKPLIKPVGWVSPNTWGSHSCQGMEGDYVDLVDISNGKQPVEKRRDSCEIQNKLVSLQPVRPPPPIPLGQRASCRHAPQHAEDPCNPCSQMQPGLELFHPDLKCRYRESYLAALSNPVAFERGGADLLSALEEVHLCEEGEGKPRGTPEPTTVCVLYMLLFVVSLWQLYIFSSLNTNICILLTKLFLKYNTLAAKTFFLFCCPACTGSRDRNGRAVVEVHGDREEWMSPLVSAQSVCELLLYLHAIPRKDVRQLGMTLIINARKKPPPLHLYKALLMAQALHPVHCIIVLMDKDTCPRPEKHPGLQMDLVTSLRALNKTVEASQVTSDLGGTFTYSHTDWLQFYQDGFTHFAVSHALCFLVNQEVQQSIQEQKILMKNVLEDARLVTLQREGGALLARMKREEFRFPQSEDYRDALESATSLYNQVEEKLHTLVMRSNESLQHLEVLLKIRETEAEVITAAAAAKECGQFVEQIEEGCWTAQTLSTLQLYKERLGSEFSDSNFQALRAKACSVGPGASGMMKTWNAARVRCQEVKQRLEEVQRKKRGKDKNQIPQTAAVNPPGKENEIKGRRSELEEAEGSSILQPIFQTEGAYTTGSTAVPHPKHDFKTELKETQNQDSKSLQLPKPLLKNAAETQVFTQIFARKILEELLSTEREYVKALGYVREHYFPELERPDVPQDLRGQRGSVFGNLEKLHDFHHHHFLDELEGCLSEPLRVGRCFLRHRESFALYALYSKNKPQSDSLLINHGHSFFKQKQVKLGDKMDLWSYLLKPVQRISKYSLLLQDMMRECTPEQTREVSEIKAAMEVINFQLRHGNNLLAMDAIRHCDVNLKEQGQLLCQDEFMVTFRKKKCFRHVFLFQELILFSKTRKTDTGNDTYVYKQSFKFESGILDICLRILDSNPKYLRNPGKDCSGRRNPIYVSRVLSAMVNCNDDKGVLLGKWSGGYDGGVSPFLWRGSVEILRNWDSQACQPVRFGQCWVFAAVACSVSRALGMPCRVVTNFLSAHDTNSNLTIERYIDENGELVQSRDMIWNFHCWIENWMTRPDLKADFNGWQVSDPTPQEKSEGVYCCGPIPVKAIKEGELTFKYDAPFVFAEVNADVVTFMKKKDGSTSKVTTATVVGQKISTKKVGSDAREDITHLYKYPEGSDEEREAFTKANHQNKLLQQLQNAGLHLAIKVTSDMKKGCDFDVFAVVTNNTQSEKMCRLVFGSCAESYNGTLGENCGFKDLLNVGLSPGAERRIPLRLNYSKYGSHLTEDNLIRLAALVVDYSTKEAILAVRHIVLENPEIKVRILGEPKENRKLAAEITLQNPLPEPLENCCFSIEGANLTGGHVLSERLSSTVGPGEDAKVKIYFTPSHSGLRKLVVDFDSNKLCHVKGYRNVIIGK
uniref:protein-glutamine gamma-glutamyltransferase n=1 Tax=Oryzias sinensis TaxID=183150 RepID=A0A8C8DZI6_9TELE